MTCRILQGYFLIGCPTNQGRAEGRFLEAELHLTLPPQVFHPTLPEILSATPYFEALQNYRKMFFKRVLNPFMAHVYLVNVYFLTAPGKSLTVQVKCENRWGASCANKVNAPGKKKTLHAPDQHGLTIVQTFWKIP